MLNHPDRLLPAQPFARDIARELLATVEDLPIISPHGHCDPSWFAYNDRFPDPAQLFVVPDHYVFRMLASKGISLAEIGVNTLDNTQFQKNPQKIWKKFSENYYLFRGTPTSIWLDYSFEKVFGITEPLTSENGDFYFHHIEEKLSQPEFLPQALFERFNIELLATTDSAVSELKDHNSIQNGDWSGRIIPTYRPDAVIDPENREFKRNLLKMGELTDEDVSSWLGYLNAHKSRRLFFKKLGATATDHGHPTARTENLSRNEAEKII